MPVNDLTKEYVEMIRPDCLRVCEKCGADCCVNPMKVLNTEVNVANAKNNGFYLRNDLPEAGASSSGALWCWNCFWDEIRLMEGK